MLDIIKVLNYEINNDGVVEKVHVGFSNYNDIFQGTLSVAILADEVDGDILEMSPNAIKQIAQEKILDMLANGESLENLTERPQPEEI